MAIEGAQAAYEVHDEGVPAVEICARPPHTAFLVVGYDGLRPPAALFDDLAMIGWTPPTPAPPPRDAIDWDTPNLETGERFTVRSYRVDGAVVEPPAGSGPRGSWNPLEGDAFLRALHGVLRRHGVAPTGTPRAGTEGAGGAGAMASRPPGAPPPPGSTAAEPPQNEPTRPRRRTTLRSLGAMFTNEEGADSGAPGEDRDAALDRLALLLTVPEDGAVALRASIDPARFPALDGELTALEVRSWSTEEAHEVLQHYRASQVSTTVTRVAVTALAGSATAADAVAAFEHAGAPPAVEVLDPDAVAELEESMASRAPAPAPDPDEADGEWALVRQRCSCARVVVEPGAVEAVIAVMRRLGLRHAERSADTIETTARYRGNAHVQRRPAVRFDVWVPPVHAHQVWTELCRAGGIDPAEPGERASLIELAADPDDHGPVAKGDAEALVIEAARPDDPTTAAEPVARLEPRRTPEVSRRSDTGDEVLTRR